MDTNSILTLTYTLTEKYRQRVFRETGQLPAEKQTAEYDMREASPEEREIIFYHTGGSLDLVATSDGKTEFDYWPSSNYRLAWSGFDGEPTIQQLVKRINSRMAAILHLRHRLLTEMLAEKNKKLIQKIEKRDPSFSTLEFVSKSDRKNFADYGVDTGVYDATLNAYNEQSPVWVAEKAAEAAAAEARREAAVALREAENDAREGEKLVWVDQHGSEHLKRACAAGHNCGRMYLIERAAIEYPDFVLDYDKRAEWKSRSCPSLAALDKQDAILDGATDPNHVEIVWLTREPIGDDEQDYYEQPEQREAVVVLDDHYNGRWLISK